MSVNVTVNFVSPRPTQNHQLTKSKWKCKI